MKGYRSLIVAGVGVVVSIAPVVGVEIMEQDAEQLTAALLFVAAFVMRFVTTTPVGKSY
mgnify:CR=1 FL=1